MLKISGKPGKVREILLVKIEANQNCQYNISSNKRNKKMLDRKF